MTQSATTFGDNNFVIQIAGDGNSGSITPLWPMKLN